MIVEKHWRAMLGSLIMLVLVAIPTTLGLLYAHLSRETLGLDAPAARPAFMWAASLGLTAATAAGALALWLALRMLRQIVWRLQDSEARMRSVVDTAVDAIISIDSTGIVFTYNTAAQRIFGYLAHEVIGQNINMLMPNPYRQEHTQYLNRYLKTNEPRIIGIGREVMGCRKDGTVFPMDLAVSEMTIGQARAFTGICRDITARKQVENALFEANQRLVSEQAKRIQAEKLSSVGLLAAGVAHEINNPLSGIMGCVQALQADKVAADSRQAYFDTVREGLERIGLTVRGLLDYARYREFSPQPVAVSDVVAASLRLLNPALLKKNVEVQVAIDDAADVLEADRAQLMQGIVNIILNAIYAVQKNGVIGIQALLKGDRIAIEISDSGPGIAEEVIDKVCDPFFSTKPEGEGTGLGLAVTLGIVRSHRGELTIRNRHEGGACITLWFPKRSINADVQRANEDNNAKHSAG